VTTHRGILRWRGGATANDGLLRFRSGDSFFDVRDGVRIEPPRGVEKYLCALGFAVNFDCKLVMALFGAAQYRTDFENLVLTTRRIAPLEETVVVIECYFNDCLLN
jgi:hypothetical protein